MKFIFMTSVSFQSEKRENDLESLYNNSTAISKEIVENMSLLWVWL